MAVLRFVGSLISFFAEMTGYIAFGLVGLLCWISATTPEATCGQDPLHAVPQVVAEELATQHQTLARCAKLRDPLIVDDACKSAWKESGQHFLEGGATMPDMSQFKPIPCASPKPVPLKVTPNAAIGARL